MYLTLKEAAEQLRLDPETVRLKFFNKEIPGAFRTDGDRGNWRIAWEDLDRWAKEQQEKGKR